MMRIDCKQLRARISDYCDGALAGRDRLLFDKHMAQCGNCESDLSKWRKMQQSLAALGPRSAPADLGLRLRVAVSQARARQAQRITDRWELHWQNSLRPLAVQWGAGLASALAVLAAVGLLVGVFAAPQRVQASTAKDEPLGMATAPHYLYSMFPHSAIQTSVESSLVVEVFLGADGRVYDYKILGGEDSPAVRAQLNNALYFTVFEPARVFGRGVPSHAVVSYAGVAVRG